MWLVLHSKSQKTRGGHLVSRKHRTDKGSVLLVGVDGTCCTEVEIKSNFGKLMHPCRPLSCHLPSSSFCSHPNFISLNSHLDRVSVPVANKCASCLFLYYQSSGPTVNLKLLKSLTSK